MNLQHFKRTRDKTSKTWEFDSGSIYVWTWNQIPLTGGQTQVKAGF